MTLMTFGSSALAAGHVSIWGFRRGDVYYPIWWGSRASGMAPLFSGRGGPVQTDYHFLLHLDQQAPAVLKWCLRLGMELGATIAHRWRRSGASGTPPRGGDDRWRQPRVWMGGAAYELERLQRRPSGSAYAELLDLTRSEYGAVRMWRMRCSGRFDRRPPWRARGRGGR